MHRPLRVPLHLRLWNLIKGVVFYNTVYWEKASDGLNMPKLTREEREKARPTANMEIIRPREKPRARLDTFRGAEISNPYEPQISEPRVEPFAGPPAASVEGEPDDGSATDGAKYVKRRKYKRRRVSGQAGGNGFFRRVFGK